MTRDRVISFGTGVDQTVKRISYGWHYRHAQGTWLLDSVSSYDNATVGSGTILNQVVRRHSDFNQLKQEFQEHAGAADTDPSGGTSLQVEYSYGDGSDSTNHIRPTSITYPSGRVISYDYGSTGATDDVLNRIASIKQSATTYASYTYLGGGSIVRRNHPQPQVRLDLWGGTSGTYSGLDRFGRVVDQLWRDYGASADRERFGHGYDRNSNRIYRDHTVTSAKDEYYAYGGQQSPGGSIGSSSRGADVDAASKAGTTALSPFIPLLTVARGEDGND
ncbi:hypothetical protein [Fontivita pretiosa]|uniref:hypothetical protein n=1 Tax=Fontivita pretiosa TaxID=2989684 RepID=UPI003D16D8F6